LLVFEASFFDL